MLLYPPAIETSSLEMKPIMTKYFLLQVGKRQNIFRCKLIYWRSFPELALESGTDMFQPHIYEHGEWECNNERNTLCSYLGPPLPALGDV